MNKMLLDLLVCPVSKSRLELDETRMELVSVVAKLAYPIRDGIPVMLEEEARRLNSNEVASWEQRRED